MMNLGSEHGSQIQSLFTRSVTLLTAVGVVLFCSTAEAEHGGRDRTERDDHHAEAHGGGDREHARDTDRSAVHENDGPDDKSGGDDKDSGKGASSKRERENRKHDSTTQHDVDTSMVAGTESRIASEVDFEGKQRRSGEVIMMGRDEHIAAIRAAGYRLISTQRLDALGESIARIRINDNASIEDTLQALHAIAPDADIASNHLFKPSQELLNQEANVKVLPGRSAAAKSSSQSIIGVIDTGADKSIDALKVAVVDTQALTESGYVARLHGTVVAQIACTEGAHLAVADVFGVDADNHLVAPAEAIARAIDWLLIKHVMLINVSIEGPDNIILAHVIRRAIAQGAVIVAAAGNSGPAAPAAYPAAYPGVVAVTAVDEHNNVYPRANRGEYIAFAARGVRVPVSRNSNPATVSGTSFAAPVVAAEIARRMETSPGNVVAIVDSMKHDAVDLGAAGHDTIFGWGLITTQNTASATR